MNESSARLMVAVVDQMVCLKINGRADFTLSKDSEKLIHELWGKGYRRFVIELRDCTSMDSTYLGMLSGIGLKYSSANSSPVSPVELLNPNPRIAEVLENLGVAHLFKITECPDFFAANFEPLPQAPAPSKADVTRSCLEAHQLLMSINPENVKKFKDVAKFLAEDLERLEFAEKK